ncbi:MAG: outer membrane protein [Chitinophagales bacterium]|nr:MAG: outer membrane protein [Chitinophagales bacterium]
MWILLILCTSVHAQERWSLKQCITYALEHHLSNAIYKGNEEKARLMILENIGLYLPQISSNVTFDNNFKQQTVVLPENLAGLPINDREVRFGTQFVTTASVTLEQALFDRVLLASFRAKKPSLEVASLYYQQNQENLIYNTTQAYLQVYIADAHIKLLQQNQEKYRKLLEIVKLQADQGLVKKTDVSKLTVALNNIQAQLRMAESSRALAMNSLKNAMGMESDQELLLEDSILFHPEPLEQLTSDFDAGSKTEALIQKKNLLLLDVQRKRILGGYYPRLSFYAQYGAQAFAEDFSRLFHNWYDYSALGLKLQIPLFDSFQKAAQARQAAINLRNAVLSLQLSEAGYRLQFDNAVLQAQKARINLDDTRANTELARSIFDQASLQYQQGIAPLSELLGAETALKEAQSNYLLALLAYYSAILDLQKSKGTLLSFYQNL